MVLRGLRLRVARALRGRVKVRQTHYSSSLLLYLYITISYRNHILENLRIYIKKKNTRNDTRTYSQQERTATHTHTHLCYFFSCYTQRQRPFPFQDTHASFHFKTHTTANFSFHFTSSHTHTHTSRLISFHSNTVPGSSPPCSRACRQR